MRNAKYGLFLILPFLTASNLKAQFTPLQAKIRESHVITSDGKAILRVKEGNYYRSSDGSVLIQWLTVNGEKTGEGTLQDNKGLKFYHLDYAQNRAFEEQGHPGVAVKPGGFASITKDIGTDSVEGVSCRIIPIRIGGIPGAPPTDAGKSCVSPQYDLRVWEEVVWTGDTNRPERTRTELSGIKIGAEPDPGLFDVRSKFTVFTGKPPDATNPSQHQ